MFKDLSIKKAVKGDEEVLMKLRLQLVKENPKTYGVLYTTERKKGLKHYSELIREHSTGDSGIFLLKVENKFVGMGVVRRDQKTDPEIGYLGSLGIIRKYQGKGLGNYLLKYRLEWLEKNTKFKKVKTIVQKGNNKMLSLAKKYGFNIVGEGSYYDIPEYYLEKNVKQPTSN